MRQVFKGPGWRPWVVALMIICATALVVAPSAFTVGGTSKTNATLTASDTGAASVTGASLALGAATHWVSVQSRQDLTPYGQWFWGTRCVGPNSACAPATGNPAAFQNPGNGFGTGCTTWAVRTTCIPTSIGPDQ